MDEKTGKKHIVNLVDRERLSMSGVTDVYSFDEAVIELETVEGYVDIEGTELHIVKMNLDNGELLVEGKVSQISYQDQDVKKKKGSVLSKLFK